MSEHGCRVNLRDLLLKLLSVPATATVTAGQAGVHCEPVWAARGPTGPLVAAGGLNGLQAASVHGVLRPGVRPRSKGNFALFFNLFIYKKKVIEKESFCGGNSFKKVHHKLFSVLIIKTIF